jgi:hypothetical protein
MLSPDEIRASTDIFNAPVMFAPGDATTVQTSSGQGLGSGAATWRTRLCWLGLAGVAAALAM